MRRIDGICISTIASIREEKINEKTHADSYSGTTIVMGTDEVSVL